MKETPKLKLKNKDVDETAEEVLADDEKVSEEVPTQTSDWEPSLEASTTASEITVDVPLVKSSENVKPRSSERKQLASVETSSSNDDRKLSDLKPSLATNKPSRKVVQKHPSAEVIDTDEYLIITLSASHRRELPKTKKSQKLLISEGSEDNAVTSKVKYSGQASTELIIPSTQLKVSDEHTDCVSTDTGKSIEDTPVSSETTEAYKAKTPIVLYDASEATTKYPDGEFYAELRNHTTPTKWNNPVRYNRYPIYYDPNRIFPYRDKSKNTFRKNATLKYPKKFSTFRLRVLKSKKERRETENMSKTERLSEKTSKPHESRTEEIGNPSVCSRVPQISTSAKMEKDLFEKSPETIDSTKLYNPLSTLTSSEDPTDIIASTSTTGTMKKPLMKPNVSKHRHRYSTSYSEDTFSKSTRTEENLDTLVPTSSAGISPVQIHSTSITEAEPVDPLSMNPIKFREKLRKLSQKESCAESPGVQKKELGSKHKTRAVLKTRAEPTSEAKSGAKSKIGLISSTVLTWNVPERELVSKDRALRHKNTLPKEEIPKHGDGSNDEVPKSGGIPKDVFVPKSGDFSKIGEMPTATEGTILKVRSMPKGESISTEEPMPKGEVALKKRGIPTERTILKGESLAVDESLQKTKAIPKTGKISTEGSKDGSKLKKDISLETGTISKTESFLTRTVTVLQQDETSSKTLSVLNFKKGQYRDIPVIAYVRRLKRHPPKRNLDYYLPKEDGWIRCYWRKFKYYKRIETERQQSLLKKIVDSLSQIDISLQSAYNYSNSIEKLRQVTCDLEESLSYRNNKMKWLLSRLMHKTEILSDFLETIRCDIVLYTLETSASNDITSKRLYKLLKYLCGKQERKRKSGGKLTPVEEEDLRTKT